MHQDILREMARHPRLAAIMEDREFLRLANFRHHGRMSCRDHCLRVAALTFLRSSRKGCDFLSATRGALLHDFFFYNWRFEGPRFHGFRHPTIACRNAERRFLLNDIERDVILRHMWPLTPVPPKYMESRIVCWADKTVSLGDYRQSVRGAMKSFGGRIKKSPNSSLYY